MLMKRVAFFALFCMCVIIRVSAQQPAFKGGPYQLNRFLSSKIIYPEYSRQNCIGGTVQVSFRLDEKGKVSNASVQQGTGVDLDDEALRVIRLTSGKWIMPANYNPATRIVLPVKFTPDVSQCRGVNNQSAAIQAYRNRKDLESVVTTYYKNKYLGKADSASESKIVKLKEQLELNDEFIDEMLNSATSKLKQGDTEGACASWQFIRNIGSNRADEFIEKYCR